MNRTIAVSLCAALMSAVPGAVSAAAPAAGPAVAQKKILIVYYSRTGNTQKVAEALAQRLGADVERIIDRKDRSGAKGYLIAGKDATKGNRTEIDPPVKDPAAYDLVVIGTPVWAWTMAPAIRTYIEDKKAGFKAVAFFSTAGGSGMDRTAGKMAELAGKPAVATLGIVESELKDKNKDAYGQKLDAFAAALK